MMRNPRRSRLLVVVVSGLLWVLPLVAAAAEPREIHVWHAMGGALGERVGDIATGFNTAQSQCKVTPTYKGNYTEVMTAGIAAFRAGKQPHVLQVFEVGTATMMAAKGAIKPVYEVMEAGWRDL